MNRTKGELKRPLAFVMVICMLVAMFTGFNTPESVHAESVVAAKNHDTETITGDIIWASGSNISTGAIITIEDGASLTVSGEVHFGDDVIITGGGVLRMGQPESCLRMDDAGGWTAGTITVSGITIVGNSAATRPMISAGGNSTYFENVTFKDAKQTKASYSSAIITSAVDTNIYLMGNTCFVGNSADMGTVYLAQENNHLHVSGTIVIKDNTNAAGDALANVNLRDFHEDTIIVDGDLSTASSIGILNVDSSSDFGDLADISFAENARQTFFSDTDFHNKGIINVGTDLKFCNKIAINTNCSGDGTVEYYDSHGRSLVASSSTGIVTGKATPGNPIAMYIIPGSRDDFVKSVSVSNSGVELISTASVSSYSLIDVQNKKDEFTMPTSVVNADVVFEKAITSLNISGLELPLAFVQADDNLAGAFIDGITPAIETATATITSIEWYDGTTKLTTDKFEYGKDYTLKATLTATNGSRFSPSVGVNAISTSMTVDVDDTQTVLTAEQTYTSEKQSILDAISSGVVRVDIVSGSGIYDGTQHHGPLVSVEDDNNAASVISRRIDAGASYLELDPGDSISTSLGTAMRTTTTSIYQAKNAGTYTVYVKIENDNYKDSYTTTVAFNITKRAISPLGLDLTYVDEKPYDGTTSISGVKVNFSNLATGDALVLGTDYSASFAYIDKYAGSPKTINATSISLNDTDLANNYILSTNSSSGSGGGILKVTPELIPGNGNSISHAAVRLPGTTLRDINFGLGTWFANHYATGEDAKVYGTLELVNSSDAPLDLDSTIIEKNKEYKWLFRPTDDINYRNAFGMYAPWPAEPITRITLSGIELPVANTTNSNIGASISGICGPNDTSAINSVETLWEEYDQTTSHSTGPAIHTNSPVVYKYNRTYTLTIRLTPQAGDQFSVTESGIGALSVAIASGSSVYQMTKVSVTSQEAIYTYTTRTGFGLLDDSCLTVPDKTYEYDGTQHNITFSSILSGTPGFSFQTKMYGDSSYGAVNVLKGETDVVTDKLAYVSISHPDYRTAGGQECLVKHGTITITPKPIEHISITNVVKRPFDNTTAVAVILSSSDICAVDTANLTFSAIGEISDKNVNTGTVTVTASSITLGGIRAGQYILSPAGISVTTSSAFNAIQKVTPTHGGITWTAITVTNPKFADLGVSIINPQNPFAIDLGNIPGTIECYTLTSDGTFDAKRVGSDPVMKFSTNGWKFIPSDTTNYEIITGTAVFWPGQPIKELTIAGITAPVALATSATKGALSLELPETADITISSISWHENDTDYTTGGFIAEGDAFKYNRSYTVTVTLSALGPETFSPSLAAISAAAKMDLGAGDVRSFDVVLSGKLPDSDNYKTATLVYTFETRTSMGALADENLNRDYFKSIDATGAPHPLYGEAYSTNWSYNYIYSGRRVSPDPKAVSLQAIDIVEFQYRVNGGAWTETVPEYTNYTPEQVEIDIQMTHPDYTGTITKKVYLRIAKCKVRPEGVIYSGKVYDGTNKITGAKIIWMPNDAGFELGTASAISDDLITYTAKYEFDNENVSPNKQIKVTNISASGENFDIEVVDVAGLVTKIDATSCWMTSCGALISKSSVKPKDGSILRRSISSAVSLSAIVADYMTTDCSITNGSIMVNPQNASLTVYGRLYLTTGGGVEMTAEELEGTVIVQGAAYTWAFEPNDRANYLSVVTGSQILWPMPPPVPAGGGGGGGGTVETPPPTTDGIVVTSGAVGVDKQIHIYLSKDDKIVTDEYFYAEAEGGAVAAALTKVPNGNVLIDSDGNVVVKGIIENGKLQTYLKGDNYLTVAYRSTDYVDVKGRWFEKHVDFCSARDIVNGVGEGRFDPDGTLTRGMAATILYRLEETPEITSSARWFADVEKDKWYSDGIAWAGGEGILSGVGTKNFAPHWAITREQMAVMIYNYCQKVQGSAPVEPGSLDMSLYYDSGDISYWAKDAVAFCYKTGLMAGDEDGNFCPRLSTTRAEFATIMERLVRGILNQTI